MSEVPLPIGFEIGIATCCLAWQECGEAPAARPAVEYADMIRQAAADADTPRQAAANAVTTRQAAADADTTRQAAAKADTFSGE